jgi:hypothetical protein
MQQINLRGDGWTHPPNFQMVDEVEGVDFYICECCEEKVYYDSGPSRGQTDHGLCQDCFEDIYG